MSKHRAPQQDWPLNMRVYLVKNRWRFFIKPQIKREATRLARLAVVFLKRWPNV